MKISDEREIDLGIIFAYALKDWRKILIVSILFCLVGISYTGYKVAKGNATTYDKSDESTQEYNEQKKLAEESVENTNNSINMLTQYMNSSILANIDPYNETVTATSLTVICPVSDSTEGLVVTSNDPANRIVQVYASYISDNLDYDELAKSFNITPQEIKEVVTVKSNFDSDSIAIKVVGNDSTMTEKIMNYILESIKEKDSEIRKEYGEYKLISGNNSTNVVIDSELISTVPSAATTLLLSNNKTMSNILTRISSLKSTLASQQKSLDSLSDSNLGTSNISTKTFLKYGLGGFLIGFLFINLFYIIKVIMMNTVLSEDDVKTICGIKSLAVLPMIMPTNKNRWLDHVAYRKLDSSYNIGSDVSIEMAITNIQGLNSKPSNILLVGNDLKMDLSEISLKLQSKTKDLHFEISNNINADSTQLRKLQSAEAVVVVVQRNTTRIEDLTKTVDTINNWHAPIIGSIIA